MNFGFTVVCIVIALNIWMGESLVTNINNREVYSKQDFSTLVYSDKIHQEMF